jgi:Rap1a immunity proteins
MPGCRTVVNDTGWNENGYKAGLCSGTVSGIFFMDTGGTCPPNGVTHGQMIRVVAHYVDARPARQHEDFMKLAVEAFRAACPAAARRRIEQRSVLRRT